MSELEIEVKRLLSKLDEARASEAAKWNDETEEIIGDSEIAVYKALQNIERGLT